MTMADETTTNGSGAAASTQQPWVLVRVGDSTKPHAVPMELRAGILADLETRGGVLKEEESIKRSGIDYGGAVYVGRPWTDVDLGGFQFSVPCDGIHAFLRMVRELPLRH